MKTWSDQKCWKNDLKAQMFTLRASKIWIIWRQSSECLCKKFWVVGSTPEADRNQTDRLWRSHVHSERSLNCVCSILQHSDILRGNATETSINSSLIFTQLLIHGQWEERRTQSGGGRETASNTFQLHGRKTAAYISLRSLKSHWTYLSFLKTFHREPSSVLRAIGGERPRYLSPK